MTETPFKPIFNENDIVLNIGIISDVHVKQAPDEENSDKLRAALHQLKRRAGTGKLDLLMAVGDMCNDGTPDQMARLRAVLSEQLSFTETPMLYALGNHERHTEDCLAVKCAAFADTTFGDPDDIAAGRQHFTIGGYHFLSVDASVFGRTDGIHYTPETIAWLDTTLAALTAAEPERYIFIQTHALVWDTVYGTRRGPFYQSDDFCALLARYPQAVIFGGHLHYPLNDERCIMQKGFTAVETASVSYMLIDGEGYVGIEKKSRLPDRRAFSQGLLMQIDRAGAVRLTRLDFHHDAVIKQPWDLPAPSADGAHLTRYPSERHFAPPTLCGPLHVEIVTADDERRVQLTFPAATSPDMVRGYDITLRAEHAPEEPICFRYFSDFYRCPRIDTMAKTCTYLLPPLERGAYTVEVCATDSWGGCSPSISGHFTL